MTESSQCLVNSQLSEVTGLNYSAKMDFSHACVSCGSAKEVNPMQTLKGVLQQAEQRGIAIGHFNVSDLVLLKAVFTAAQELNMPVIVGASEGERAFMGVNQIAALVKSLRDEYDFPIFLNADHTHSLASGEEVARAGFDSIVFDLSALPFEENVRKTKEAVVALKSIHPSILVEGEIGDIGSGSEIHDFMPDRSKKGLTTPEQARQFVGETGINILAPAVGNMHGMSSSMVQGALKKRLDIERIAAIKKATGVPLTLHGGSGTEDDDFRRAIAAGISIVHINTELRVAWRRSLESSLARTPEIVPYKILPPVVESVREVVMSRLSLFNNPRLVAQAQGSKS
jgi:fructose-bisphosphate aldolase, class II